MIYAKSSMAKGISNELNILWQSTWEESGKDKRNDEVWGRLYNYIFSDKVSSKIYKLCPDFHYPDPDASYYDDVTAFISGFEDYANQ